MSGKQTLEGIFIALDVADGYASYMIFDKNPEYLAPYADRDMYREAGYKVQDIEALLEEYQGKRVRITIEEIPVCAVCGEPIVREIDVSHQGTAEGCRELILLCPEGHQTNKVMCVEKKEFP